MVGKWNLDPNHVMEPWIEKNLPEMAAKPRKERGPADISAEIRKPYYPSERGFMETTMALWGVTGQILTWREMTRNLNGDPIPASVLMYRAMLPWHL